MKKVKDLTPLEIQIKVLEDIGVKDRIEIRLLKEQLRLCGVGKQRELLLGFLNWYDSDRVYTNKSWTNEEAVGKYIKDKL